MQHSTSLLPRLSILTALLASCSTGTGLRVDELRGAEGVELAVDEQGRAVEIEYQLAAEDLPAAVLSAMEELHPGGRVTGGEKEFLDSGTYWEVAKEIDGRSVEAMFTASGELHSEEVEIAPDAVPEAVQAAFQSNGYGPARSWEELRDGARTVLEYHVKTTRGDDALKVRFAPDGGVLQVLREMQAEIEVPLPR